MNHQPLKYKLCHINFWAKDPANAEYIPEEPTYDVGVINRYIAAMKKKGWLCGLNHPAWSRQTTEEINGITGVDTFEVYNHGSFKLYNNGDGQIQYSMYLAEGKRAWATAVDDNHAGFREDGTISVTDDTLGGFIMMSMPQLTYADFADFSNKFFHIFSSGRWRNVTSVEESVNINLVKTVLLSHFEKTVEVFHVAVYAARGKKTHKVECAALSLAVFDSGNKCRVCEEVAVLDGLGNLNKHLINNSACADVCVANFGVTHLTVRKTNIKA